MEKWFENLSLCIILFEMLETIVSESVFLYCKPTISALRCFGGAPFGCRRVKEGFVFKKSRGYAIYSYGLAVFLVGLSMFGLWCDVTACGREFSRVRGSTDLYINTFDLGIVVLNVLFGLLMSPMKVEDLFGILQCLTKIDVLLKEPWSTLDKDRKFSKISFFIGYALSVSGVVFEADYKFGKGEEDVGLKYLRNYGAIFLFYTVTLTQQVAYWNVIRLVRGRIRTMNRKIELEIVKLRNGRGCFEEVGILDFPLQRLRLLLTVHEQIYSCVNSINKFFDYPILLILVNFIVEMVVNPWILITREPTLGVDRWTLVIWILLRGLQLFILIEPIHGVLVENGNTKLLIVQLMKQAKDGPLRREIELLSTQYQMWQIEFSTVDMIYLQRSIYTAVASAVTTYLVILIQLNK